MKKIIIIFLILFSSSLYAEDKATSVCIENGTCVPAKDKQEIVDHCKSVLDKSKGELIIAIGWADYVVRNMSWTQIKGKFVEGKFFSVDLWTAAIDAGKVNLLCVYDSSNKLVRIGKPVNETKANMAIYKKALTFIE